MSFLLCFILPFNSQYLDRVVPLDKFSGRSCGLVKDQQLSFHSSISHKLRRTASVFLLAPGSLLTRGTRQVNPQDLGQSYGNPRPRHLDNKHLLSSFLRPHRNSKFPLQLDRLCSWRATPPCGHQSHKSPLLFRPSGVRTKGPPPL